MVEPASAVGASFAHRFGEHLSCRLQASARPARNGGFLSHFDPTSTDYPVVTAGCFAPLPLGSGPESLANLSRIAAISAARTMQTKALCLR
jgi:hypothetical protein